jgi:hypothetical protein
MSPPLPAVVAQGQGVVSADQFNTYVQTVATFAQLRTFVGVNEMTVLVLGGASSDDGLQGLFYYNSTSTAIDNNSTVIVPTGNLQGAWLLLPPGSQSPGSFASLTVTGNGSFGGNVTIGGTLGVSGAATFASDISMTGTGELGLPAGTTAQRTGTPVVGDIRYNTTLGVFEGYGAAGWAPLAGLGTTFVPSGRLTLTSGLAILSNAVVAATGIIFTPYQGNQVPSWNGSTWTTAIFTEISEAFSDVTNSPAAAVANSLYDVFVWFKSGVATLSRSPVWTNSTTRSLALSLVQGFYVNSLSITNGPAAGYGLWVGTFATDTSGATCTFNPQPAPASAGPATPGAPVGAWVGLWNTFNRVPIVANAQDSKASWTYATATWREADASANNRITLIAGGASSTGNSDDPIEYAYSTVASGVSSNFATLGVAIDSTTTPTTISTNGSGSSDYTISPVLDGGPFAIGQHFLQAMEYASGATATLYGTNLSIQVMTLYARWRF